MGSSCSMGCSHYLSGVGGSHAAQFSQHYSKVKIMSIHYVAHEEVLQAVPVH